MKSPFLDGTPLFPDAPRFFREDAVEGARARLADGSVDLIVTDPPYGIGGDRLDRHYNRDESFVLDGYVEVPAERYAGFTRAWVAEAGRVLRPGGALFALSGYTRLLEVLGALRESGLEEVNHLVWKYNFGVHTTRKFVSSHYHVLYWAKPGGERTFERFCRFGEGDRDGKGGSLLYRDLEDVWSIPRAYRPGTVKNRNALPPALLAKILQYCSREGEVVCDFFLGSFATAKAAKGMNRRATGFELNPAAFEAGVREVEGVAAGSWLAELKKGRDDRPANRGRAWDAEALDRLAADFLALRAEGLSKREAVSELCGRFGRGRFAVLNALKRRNL